MAHGFDNNKLTLPLHHVTNLTTETPDTSPLRFNSLTLDELSEELERRTKETQRLQEEVENAAKFVLDSFSSTYDITSSPGLSSINHSFDVDGSSCDSTRTSTHQPSDTPPLAHPQDVSDCGNINAPGKQACDGHKQEVCCFEQAVVNLQAQLENVQMENKALTDLRKQGGHGSVSCSKAEVSPATKTQDELNNAVTHQNKRIEPLIANISQEMAMLTNKLSSSNDSGVKLCFKLEQLRKLAKRQASLRHHQVCCLEQQLVQAQAQLVDAQTVKEQSLQQAEELQSQLNQVKRCSELQQLELQGQLKEATDQLHRAAEEKTCLQALLEQDADERRGSQEEELQRRMEEVQQHLATFEDAQSECQTLRLKLDDREKMVEFLRFQMENNTQMIAQHRHTIELLHQENNLLSNQHHQHKLEIQHVRAELDKHKSDLAELKRVQPHVTVMEQSPSVQEETLEKQQLTTQLEVQRLQLLTLTKDQEELQRLHSCQKEEHEGVVRRLQAQLRSTKAELDQVRGVLSTLTGADGHGLQVAVDMKKEVAARRKQTADLQGRVHHLEENVEKLHQERRSQSLESQRQLKELALMKQEKSQLAQELDAIRTKDKQLQERIRELEAILHKMSESFADCQDFIQLQEQQFFRLKLKHALDLKEFQGQSVRTPLNVTPPVLASSTSHVLSDPPSSQQPFNAHIKGKNQLEGPTRELRSLVKELRGVISGNHRPHTANTAAGRCICRRTSTPEREDTTAHTEPPGALTPVSRLRGVTCGREPGSLRAADLAGQTQRNKLISKDHVVSPAATHTSSTKLLSLGRKSPVHALLTSDPNS